MAYPFNGNFPLLKKHTEDEYLKLENEFKNLFIAVRSLVVIYENTNHKDDIKLGALSKRINQIIGDYKDFEGSLTLKSTHSLDSATTIHKKDSPQKYAFRVSKNELDLIIEGLDNMAILLGPKDHEYTKFSRLSNQLTKFFKKGKK